MSARLSYTCAVVGAIGVPRPGTKAIVARQIDERSIVDNALGLAFTDDGGLHPVVEYLARRPARRLESPPWQRSPASTFWCMTICHRRIAADVAASVDLAKQPPARQARIGLDPLVKIS